MYGIKISGSSIEHATGYTIFDNIISGNSDIGILLENYDNSTIYENNINGNINHGIKLTGDDGCSNVTIDNNKISDNTGDGIQINSTGLSSDISISYNNIMYNLGFGVGLYQMAKNNTIHHNNFIDNNGSWIQGHDETGMNFWNDTNERGNYWSEYTLRYPSATWPAPPTSSPLCPSAVASSSCRSPIFFSWPPPPFPCF